MKILKQYLPLSAILFLFLTASTMKAQSKMIEKFTPFAIDIIVVGSDVTLKCNSGCEWNTLSFSSASEKAQWVDVSGKTQEISVTNTSAALSAFKFSFQKEGGKFYLKSTQGTAWKEILLSSRARYVMQINEFGLLQ